MPNRSWKEPVEAFTNAETPHVPIIGSRSVLWVLTSQIVFPRVFGNKSCNKYPVRHPHQQFSSVGGGSSKVQQGLGSCEFRFTQGCRAAQILVRVFINDFVILSSSEFELYLLANFWICEGWRKRRSTKTLHQYTCHRNISSLLPACKVISSDACTNVTGCATRMSVYLRRVGGLRAQGTGRGPVREERNHERPNGSA